jgi:hypothetical protein
MGRTKNEFQTIRSEGGLLPPDLLRRVVDAKGNLPGANPHDYGLPAGERLNEAITQSWNRMRRHWADFRAASRNLPEAEAGTGLTNDKWSVPLLRELGFGLLPATPGPEIAGKTYAINRFFGTTAVHLVGCNLSLDRRAAGVRGATTNPHGLVQEFLNRSSNHLWAIVSNGLRFRVLRDNQALSRQSYLEFDLETIFSGEVYSDFVLLWLMAHATRFAPQRENQPESCWLEQWTKVAEEDGTRALGDLRSGVERALQILGEAFVSHPRNTALREALRTEKLSLNDFHGQLLRIVYRLIFLFVAEDRTLDGISLLHPLDDSDEGRQARDRYAANYSTSRLRELAAKIKGSRHGDLWQQFNLLVGALSGDERFDASRRHLALPILGSFLWSPKSTLALNATNLKVGDGVELTNGDFLESLRHLAFTRQGKMLRPVNYKNLGAEELGGVYESLLGLTPQITGDGNRFTFAEFAGNERKTSGSYYTPDSLVQCLLDSALDPVVEDALKGKGGVDAESAILSLKVCDPAVGSGHFLVGAAHRLARHLARVRANAQGESEPSPLLYQHALRDVIGRCLYGVDLNPMSAELCRVSLWLEALEPGKPLSFLDHHIQVGNSLLGTTPAVLARGIPDEAFTPIEGDLKAKCTELKRDNKRERTEFKSGQGYLFDPPFKLSDLAAELAKIDEAPDDSAEGVLEKERQYADLVKGQAYQSGRLLADTWCAAFVWKKDGSDLGSLCPTERTFRKVESHASAGLVPHVRTEVERLRDQYQFFHWHLAFPDVFRLPEKDEQPANEQTGWSNGFDVVLGNPPWEKIQPEEKQFFAVSRKDIAEAVGNERKKLINRLPVEDPPLNALWLEYQRKIEGCVHIIKRSGGFPLSEKGKLNTYSVFLELSWRRLRLRGRVGMIVQTGLVIDDSNKDLASALVAQGSLISVYDFENKKLFFPDVHPEQRFALVTVQDEKTSTAITDFSFWLLQIEDLSDENRHFRLSREDLSRISPNTGACPTFRTNLEAEVITRMYKSTDVMHNEHSDSPGWSAKPTQFINLTSDSGQFLRTKPYNEQLFPVYEGKYTYVYDHRFATFSPNDPKGALVDASETQRQNPDFVITPQFWMRASDLAEHIKGIGWNRRWFLSFHDIANPNNERTSIFAVVPFSAVGNSSPVFTGDLSALSACCLLAAGNSYAFDFVTRRRIVSRHLNFFILNQLPIPREECFIEPCMWAGLPNIALRDWLIPRVLELTYTAWDLREFARDCGFAGPPFRWDDARRFLLRSELDAAFFHLYLPADPHGQWLAATTEPPVDLIRLAQCFPKPRDAVSYIMDTFPIVRRKDEENYNGDYRTKRTILEIYDAMQESIRSGNPYQTRLYPPPGPPIKPLPEWLPGNQPPANWPANIHPPRGVDHV